MQEIVRVKKEIFVAACFGVVFGVVVGGHLAEMKQGHSPAKADLSDMEDVLQKQNQSLVQLCNENQRLRIQLKRSHLKPELGAGVTHYVFLPPVSLDQLPKSIGQPLNWPKNAVQD